MTQKITLYSTEICPYCLAAERLLKQKGVTEINKIRIDLEPSLREVMFEKTGRRTVPQIFIGTIHVGGFDDLQALNQTGKLNTLLDGDTSAP